MKTPNPKAVFDGLKAMANIDAEDIKAAARIFAAEVARELHRIHNEKPKERQSET